MDPDIELFDMSKVATLGDNLGRLPFKLLDLSTMIVEFNSTLDISASMELPSK